MTEEPQKLGKREYIMTLGIIIIVITIWVMVLTR